MPSSVSYLRGMTCGMTFSRLACVLRRASVSLAVALVALVAGVDPARAQPPDDVAPLAVQEVADGIFVFQGDIALMTAENRGAIANVGFVVGERAVAVVDSGGSAQQGAALRAAVRVRTALPIRYVVNTHMHPDHVFGNAAFTADDPVFIGHHKLGRALAARGSHYLDANRRDMGEAVLAGTEIRLPDLGVDGRLVLDLGGRLLVVESHRTAHTDNDVTVFDPKTGTAFLGDLLFSRHVPALDGSLRGWLALMTELEARPYARVVPGHGPAVMDWPAALAPQQRYLERLAAAVRSDIDKGVSMVDSIESVLPEERDKWALFEWFNARNATAAYKELEWE